MTKIKILSETLINKIAAGEVVERPFSVVKELVENSIDSGADQIFVTIKNGGKDYISVLDNGCGMDVDDAQLAIERHATSKISSNEDLERIHTMGFRGEALAAIAAVSRFELTTCFDEQIGGYQIRVEGGKRNHAAKIGFPLGTRIVIEDLFFNTPARQKFMKSVNTEYGHIHDFIIRLSLGYPDIQFKLTHNQKVVINIPKSETFVDRVKHCFGNQISDDLLEVKHEESYLSYDGLISFPSKSRPSKRWQHTFINNRYVKCLNINHGIYEGYKTLLMKNMHPLFFVRVTIDPSEVDVNVHPAKTEVRVKNARLIHTIFSNSIAGKLKLGTREQFFPATDTTDNEDGSTDTLETDHTEHLSVIPPEKPSETETSIYKEKNEQLSFVAPQPETTFTNKKKDSLPESQIRSFENKHFEKQTPDTAGDRSQIHHTTPHPESDLLEKSDTCFKVLGQLSNKYIMAQGDQKLILIDQHAAHERIRFEEIRRQFYSKTLTSVPLLIPIMMELPPQDGLLLEQYEKEWEQAGFVIDHFGGNDYSIKQIPALLQNKDIPRIIKEILDEQAGFGKTGKLEAFFNEVFEKIACHSSVRAGQSLSVEEMQSLVDQLTSLNLHLSCPHGRPFIIDITIDELDKRFKRIL
ncbi:MAG: DNA mismatch repair endonuclease MutL [Deltaproteobacteria bacterium]|jgi:DNA mismatch repair protein MutL|nr:DNA mismatch repair endonuclease MutL [Deltaproteobacteria bacterium]